jgi:dynein heavy chain, axonemal
MRGLAMLSPLLLLHPKLRAGLPDTWDNVYSYFINRVRDRLHLVLCFSPVGLRFSRWCQQFPGLISCCTIDWFLPWPQDALLAVSEALLGSCPGTEHLPQEHLSALRRIMAQLHARVSVACQEYLVQYRRTVHVTPKSYLSALNTFQELYRNKFAQLTSMASALRLGLAKIAEAKEAVRVMRGELTVQNAELAVAGAESERLLGEISQSTAAAEKEKSKVAVIVEAVRRKAAEIAEAKASAEADLAAAQPALEAALAALNSITSKDIVSLKALKSPPDVIKRIFDCVLLLR